jgi:hypothetical protein
MGEPSCSTTLRPEPVHASRRGEFFSSTNITPDDDGRFVGLFQDLDEGAT